MDKRLLKATPKGKERSIFADNSKRVYVADVEESVQRVACSFPILIIPLLRHFTILVQKNVHNMPRYYTVGQGKNMGLKRGDKMAEETLFLVE